MVTFAPVSGPMVGDRSVNLTKASKNMKKKLISLFAALVVATAANAQFQAGKGYVGGSLTSFDMNYSGIGDLSLGLQLQGGYIAWDNIMLYGTFAYEHSSNDAVDDALTVGVGGRYYIDQNGVFLGVGCKLKHAFGNYNDVMPGVEVGYAFFVNRSVTVEPAIYYDQSFKNHSDYSTIGLRIGVGIYLFDD